MQASAALVRSSPYRVLSAKPQPALKADVLHVGDSGIVHAAGAAQ